MRRTTARLRQLKTHLERCRWRDEQAALTYRLLSLAQADRPVFGTLTSFDRILKEHYTDTVIRGMALPNPLFAFIRKDKYRNETNKPVQVVGLESWLPETKPMSRIVDVDVEKPIKTRSSKEYRDNFDATFGEPEKKVCKHCGEAVVGPNDDVCWARGETGVCLRPSPQVK